MRQAPHREKLGRTVRWGSLAKNAGGGASLCVPGGSSGGENEKGENGLILLETSSDDNGV